MGPNARMLLYYIDLLRLENRSEHAQAVKAYWAAGRLTEHGARWYLRQLEPTILELQRRPNFLPRVPELGEFLPHGLPDLTLGKLVESPLVPLGMRVNDAINGIFAGRAGSGKTTAMRGVVCAVLRWNQQHPDDWIILVIIDRKGGDYADLPNAYPGLFVHVAAEQTLRMGLQQPRACPVRLAINRYSEIIAARAGLRFASTCLANIMDLLVWALNPEAVEPLLWPTFGNLLELARIAPLEAFAAKGDYEKSLIHRLEGLVQASGDLFEAHRGLEIEEHLVPKRKHLIIEQNLLSPAWVRAIATDLLFLQLLMGRQYRYERRGTINCLIIADEMDDDLSEESESAFQGHLSPVAQLIQQGREAGIGVCLGVHALGHVATRYLADLNYHCFFAVGDSLSLRTAANTLNLPPRGHEILPALVPGECVYRGPGPWADAVLAKFDAIPPSRVARPTRFDEHPYVSGRSLHEMPEVLERIRSALTNLRGARIKAKQAGTLSDDAKRFLRLAAENPYTPCARLFERLKISAFSKQKAIRRELTTFDLAEFADLRLGRRNVGIVDVLPEGYALFDQKPPSRNGRGDIAHRHLAHWVAGVGEKRGHEVQIEWLAPGTSHPVDVVWKASGKAQAFEICVGCTDNIISHLRACLLESKAVATVTIITAQATFLSSMRAAVDAEASLAPVRDRVRFEAAEEYLKELFGA